VPNGGRLARRTEDRDYAADYLSMLAEPDEVHETVTAMRNAKPLYRKAKDILRAAQLALLPQSNVHVQADLAKIADGYHRVCGVYATDENTDIPCRLRETGEPSALMLGALLTIAATPLASIFAGRMKSLTAESDPHPES
jgi:hypothetical protein